MSRVLPDLVLPGGPLAVWTDLHLRPEAPAEIAAFAAQVEAVSADTTLLLLGDLFDAWTGPETFRSTAFEPQSTTRLPLWCARPTARGAESEEKR
ncbi:MAG: hypothetical protein CMJ94_06715, partial [Planctomycetes bacterium]|nr:hypothetical protein [Planctomycetota bacterium]